MDAEVRASSILKVLELKHSEEKILFQLVIGGCITASVAMMIAIFNGAVEWFLGVTVIFWIFIVGLLAYSVLRNRMSRLCKRALAQIEGDKK